MSQIELDIASAAIEMVNGCSPYHREYLEGNRLVCIFCGADRRVNHFDECRWAGLEQLVDDWGEEVRAANERA